MSCYIVNREHVVYLVEAACRLSSSEGGFSWYHRAAIHPATAWQQIEIGDFEKMAAVGQMLWDENIKSVQARYPDTIENPDAAPGPIDESFIITAADFSLFPRYCDPVQVLKSCNCYAYQSCEHDSWKNSIAADFIQALKDAAICALPGYDAAEWGAPVAVPNS